MSRLKSIVNLQATYAPLWWPPNVGELKDFLQHFAHEHQCGFSHRQPLSQLLLVELDSVVVAAAGSQRQIDGAYGWKDE